MTVELPSENFFKIPTSLEKQNEKEKEKEKWPANISDFVKAT